MLLLKKYRREIVFFLGLTLVFFLTRLYNLLLMPIFTDEAIYLRWAQIAKDDAAWRFISLTDGKQPLFIWLVMVSLRFFGDPLFAGRLVSVMAGFLTMVGLFFLGREVFKSRWVGLVSSALYLIFPFALVYDRMALMDCLVGTFTVWSLYLTILLVRRRRLDVALILGMVAGGGVLTKSSGFFNLYLLPFSLLLFPRRSKKWRTSLLKWAGLAIIVIILTYGFYSALRLSPFFRIIAEKNALFVYPLKEWLTHPFRFLWGNLLGQWDWFLDYTTWPIIILMIGAFLFAHKFWREKILLVLWCSVPFFALALFGRVLYPRFIFFMTLSLLPLAALSIVKISAWIKKPLLFAFCCLLFAFFALRLDFLILINPFISPIPYSDENQYLSAWPAGGGVKEAVAFFTQRAKTGKVYVATEGTFGLMPYAFEIYLINNPNIEIQGFWPLREKIPEAVLQKAKEKEAYFVFNQTQDYNLPTLWPIKFINKYQKGTGPFFLSIYQVVP